MSKKYPRIFIKATSMIEHFYKKKNLLNVFKIKHLNLNENFGS